MILASADVNPCRGESKRERQKHPSVKCTELNQKSIKTQCYYNTAVQLTIHHPLTKFVKN